MPDLVENETNAEKEPDTNLWQSRVTKSEKMIKNYFMSRWELARKRIRAELDVKKQKGGMPSHNGVTVAYSIGSNFVNGIFFRAPEVNLITRDEAENDKVENTEIQINEFLKDKMVKKSFRRIIWDAFLGGFGAIYVDFQYRSYDSGRPLLDSGGQPIADDMGKPQTQKVWTKNGPIVKRIRPDLLRIPRGFDWDCVEDSPWLGFDVILPVDEVKNDTDFDQGQREKITGQLYEDLSKTDRDHMTDRNSVDSDLKFAKLSYIFIKSDGNGQPMKKMVLCKECDAPLQSEDFDKGHASYPVHILKFNPSDDDEPFPCGDMWLLESQLQAVDEWWRRMVNHIKRSSPKWLYLKRDVDKETVQKLKNNSDLEWIGLEPKSGQGVDGIMSPLQHPPIHPDNELLLGHALKFISDIGPSSGQSRGGQDSNVDTATEAQIINQKENIDLDGRVDSVKDLIIEVVRDLAGLYAKNLQGFTTISGMNKEGEEINREIDRGGFSTNFKIPQVNVESMQHPNKDVYRAQMERDMQTLSAFIEPMLNKNNESINFKFFIQKWFDVMKIPNADQAIVPLNIRNPNKEHEDFVFGKNPMGQPLPMIVQPHEKHEEHLREHEMMAKDQIASQIYEQLKPGFTESLAKHLQETMAALQAKQKGVKPPVRQSPQGRKPLVPARV